MRKRIKVTGFSDWDTMFYNNLLSIPVLAVASIVAENWGYDNLNRNLYVLSERSKRSTLTTCLQPSRDKKLLAFRDRVLWCGGGRHLVHDRLVHPGNKQHNIQVRTNQKSRISM